MRTLLTKGQKWVMTPSTMPMALLNFLGSLFRIVIIYYFLVVVGFLTMSDYPVLTRRFLMHATAGEKKIRLVSSHSSVNSSSKCFSRVAVPEPLPAVYSFVLEVLGGKKEWLVSYKFGTKNNSFTIVSRLM